MEIRKLDELRKQIILLGKEVAEAQTATQFPDWCLLKIGLNAVEGLPYENEYFEGFLKPKTINSQND